MKRNVSVLAILVLASPCAQAQLNRGTITGLVTDPSGAAVAEAKVTVVHLETNIQSSTVATESGTLEFRWTGDNGLEIRESATITVV